MVELIIQKLKAHLRFSSSFSSYIGSTHKEKHITAGTSVLLTISQFLCAHTQNLPLDHNYDPNSLKIVQLLI